MPITTLKEQNFPKWCELQYYEIIKLNSNDSQVFERKEKREKIIICSGDARLTFLDNGVQSMNISGKANVDISDDVSSFKLDEIKDSLIAVRMSGTWGKELGGSGLFSMKNIESGSQEDIGDPVPYDKKTRLDSHFHDCDEYWIAYSGNACTVSENKEYFLNTGDCLITGMGHHHDIKYVGEPLEAVYFETTLMGKKRRGHLWNHTHGTAEPVWDRV